MLRAKMYVDKLANGINPLTDQPVSDADCIKQAKISRCLLYVSDILRKVIENGGTVEKAESQGLPRTVTHEKTDPSGYTQPHPQAVSNVEKSSSPLKSIRQLNNEFKERPLIVRKPFWASDYCMVVYNIEDTLAQGTTYRCYKNGKVEMRIAKKACSIDEVAYTLLIGDQKWVHDLVYKFVTGRSKNVNTSRPIKEDHSPRKEGEGTQIKVGSLVSVLDDKSIEPIQLEIVGISHETFYKTMGYKTKNYAELIPVSSADGVNSISEISPLGSALIGKYAGDSVSITVEGKTIKYKILSVHSESDKP